MTAPPRTVGDLIREATRDLAAAGIGEARRDARILVAHALGRPLGEVTLHPDDPVADGSVAEIAALIARRAAREPTSHILGRWEFWGLPMIVTADVLTPRPDSETLIAAILETIADRAAPLSILDLGTGSGCLLLALLSELAAARGIGVDASPPALDVARRNAAALGLDDRARFIAGDWLDGVAERFDVVVCNPPYIDPSERAALAPEVADHEPAAALFAGDGGLAVYRHIAPRLAGILTPGGVVAVEVGAGQADAVAALFAEAGLAEIATIADLAGIGRCVRAHNMRESEKKAWQGGAIC